MKESQSSTAASPMRRKSSWKRPGHRVRLAASCHPDKKKHRSCFQWGETSRQRKPSESCRKAEWRCRSRTRSSQAGNHSFLEKLEPTSEGSELMPRCQPRRCALTTISLIRRFQRIFRRCASGSRQVRLFSIRWEVLEKKQSGAWDRNARPKTCFAEVTTWTSRMPSRSSQRMSVSWWPTYLMGKQ